MDGIKSNLDASCWEVEAYKQIIDAWVTYGEYVNIIRPKLSSEEREKVITLAEELKKKHKRRFNRG